MVTKAELLKGTKLTKKVFIKELDLEVEIRPLNEEQWAEIEIRKTDLFDVNDKGFDEKDSIKDSMKINQHKLLWSNFEQNILTCKYGLVMDITEEELRQISPPGIIKKLAFEILKISGLTTKEVNEIKSFRKK